MSTDPVIAAVMDEYADFRPLTEEDEATDQSDAFISYCADGKAYWRYTDEVLTKYVRGTTNEIRLAQAKVLITDRYLEFRAYAAKPHRDKVGDKGHVCLYQVWIASMHEVRTKQLALEPPKVVKLVAPKAESVSGSTPYGVLPPAVFLGEWKE